MKFQVQGLRWYIAGLLCLTSALNYLDRQTLSVLAQTIQTDLHITTVEYARITSAFLLSYTIMYAVSGRVIDALGTRRSLLIFVSGWSVANALHALARTALQFSFFRFLLGAAEPANFPAGVKAVTEWFPVRERAMAVGIFNSGTAIGAALAAPVVAWLALQWGWRSAFVIGGALGAVWVVAWLGLYRLPRQHPWLGAEELRWIEDGVPPPAQAPARVPILQLLGLRETWGCILARMLTDPISYLFMFWIPKFLQQERGFDLAAVGRYSGIPFIALAIGNLVGGAAPGFLNRRGWTINRARKSVMGAATLVMPVCMLLITQVRNPAMAIALVSLAMFCHAAWGNMTLTSEVFPTHVVGTVSGFAGAMGGLAGVISQQAIGWTVQNVSFTPVFAVSAVLYPAAFGVVCLMIRRLGVVREIPAPAAEGPGFRVRGSGRTPQ